MSSPTSPTKPLATRDINTSSPTKAKLADQMENKEGVDKPKSMEYHRQVLQNRLAEDQYVSFSLHNIVMEGYTIMDLETGADNHAKG